EPGVLLYRRNGPSLCACSENGQRTDLLLVYLVGETPTSGIHKEAFLAAVKQIESLREMACPPIPKPQAKGASPAEEHSHKATIRVAGPMFTGAADSLALAIRQAQLDKISMADFQVITGTAVSINRARFKSLAG